MLKWLRNSDRIRAWTLWLALLAAWELAYRLVGWRAWIFPAPSHIVSSVLNLLGIPIFLGDAVRPGWPWRLGEGSVVLRELARSPLTEALLTSGSRLFVGFWVSMAIGLAFGVATWRSRLVDSALGPVLLGLQTLPSVCWVPVAILTLGIGESGIMLVLVMGSFPAIATSMRDGLRTTPPIYQAVGKVFGARKLNFYLHVMLPASLPIMIGSLRTGFSFAWRSLMGGELLFVLRRHGLGHLLSNGREFGDIAQVIAVMILMVVIGMFVDPFVFEKLERRIRARYGLEAAQ